MTNKLLYYFKLVIFTFSLCFAWVRPDAAFSQDCDPVFSGNSSVVETLLAEFLQLDQGFKSKGKEEPIISALENGEPSLRLELVNSIVPHLHSLNFNSATFLFKHILKTQAEDPVSGLRVDFLFEVFKNLSESGMNQLNGSKDRFIPLLSEKQFSELTEIVYNNYFENVISWSDKFNFSEEQLVNAYLAEVKGDGWHTIRRSRIGPDFGFSSSLFGIAPVPKDHEYMILRMALALNGFMVLKENAIEGVPEISGETPLKADGDELSIEKIVDLVAEKHPDIIHQDEVRLLWDKVEDIEVGFKILHELTKLNQKKHPLPKSSLEVLSLALGYKVEDLVAGDLSSSKLGLLYRLSLDISLYLKDPAFLNVSFSPEVWQGKNISKFLSLLSQMRDLHHLYGNSQNSWDKLIDELNLFGKEITVESLDGIQSQVTHKLTKELQRVLRVSQVEVTESDLLSLYDRWGSIESVITLVSRFNGKAKWHEQIPVFGKALEAELRNRFLKYKYEGDPDSPKDQELAQQQLRSLRTDSTKAEWKKNRDRIGLFDPKGASKESEETLINRAQTIIDTNFIANLGKKGDESTPEQNLTNELLSVITVSRNTPSLKKIVKQFKLEKETILESMIQALGSINDQISMVRVLMFLKDNGEAFQFTNETKSDLVSAISVFKPKASSGETVVYSTTFDNFHMTHKIGDLVDCSSCQNYRTGSHIQTLMGYSVDAGVKGFISYAVGAKHLKDPKQYPILKSALKDLQEGKDVEVETLFNGESLELSLKITAEGKLVTEIVTKPLNKGLFRILYKLGETEGGNSGLVLERPYEQNHIARPMMVEHARQIRDEIVEKTGAVTDEEVHFVESRNTGGGIYSDAAGGEQQSDYSIVPKNSFK